MSEDADHKLEKNLGLLAGKKKKWFWYIHPKGNHNLGDKWLESWVIKMSLQEPFLSWYYI